MASRPRFVPAPSLESLFGKGAHVLQEFQFQLLLLVNICPILGITLMSPILDSLIGPFGTTPANIGLLISFFTAPAIFSIPLSGFVADRYGRRPVLVVSLLLFGLGGVFIAVVADFRLALLLRFVQGIGFGGIFPIVTTSIGDQYDGIEETAAQGYRVSVGGLSAAVFPLIAGGLVAVSWQYPFLIYAVAIPIAIAVYLWFDERTPSTRSNRTEETNELSYRRELIQLLRNPRILSLVVGRGLPTILWTGFLTYNSIVVVQVLDGNTVQAGTLVALASLVFAITASQIGRITHRFGSNLIPLLGGNVLLAVGFLVVFFGGSYPGAISGTIILGIGMGTTVSLYRSVITGLGPQSHRGILVSLAAASDRIAMTGAPIAMGGIIAVGDPIVGFESALQMAGLGAVIIGGGGSILCIGTAYRAERNVT